ncbi:MAG: thioredoxin [Oscillospiraceae bacterium]|jgi:thioredoxin 1|nr:thioredoxin [Oscillospiraceae bacterium]
MELLHASNESFDSEVLQSPQPVLVDFYADWCGPCRMLAPVIEEIAQERSDLKVVKVNVDDADAVAARYGVMSIPTVILFEGGQAAHQLVGFRSKEALLEELGL